MEIRDKALYKDVLGFDTFEAYCKERWDMGRNYMNKIIASSKVIENLGTIVPTKPATESQTRPLARLEPDQQREAWQKAVETAPEGKVTAGKDCSSWAILRGHGVYFFFDLAWDSYFFKRSSVASSRRLLSDSPSSTARCFNFFIRSSSIRVENTFFSFMNESLQTLKTECKYK